jgi:hypothetical protein
MYSMQCLGETYSDLKLEDFFFFLKVEAQLAGVKKELWQSEHHINTPSHELSRIHAYIS